MVIANGEKVSVVTKIMDGENIGTLFKAHKDMNFKLLDYISTKQYSKK